MAGKTQKNAHLWERVEHDWYVEEREPTAELFKREHFPGTIWDPCCGRGHVLVEAQLAGYPVIGSDLVDRRRVVDVPFICGAFDHHLVALGESVVFNPPYLGGKGIEQFVRQAMRYRSVQKIAAFVPAKWLWGQTRAREMHTVLPPARVYMITPRPSAPPGPVWEHAPEEVGGGSEDFAWCIWERNRADGSWLIDPFTALYWIA